MRVNEGRKGCSLPAIKMKARTVVGRGEKSLLGDPGPELRLGGEKEKEKSAKLIDGMNKRKGKVSRLIFYSRGMRHAGPLCAHQLLLYERGFTSQQMLRKLGNAVPCQCIG